MHFGLAKMNMYVDNEKTIVTDYLSCEYLRSLFAQPNIYGICPVKQWQKVDK